MAREVIIAKEVRQSRCNVQTQGVFGEEVMRNWQITFNRDIEPVYIYTISKSIFLSASSRG